MDETKGLIIISIALGLISLGMLATLNPPINFENNYNDTDLKESCQEINKTIQSKNLYFSNVTGTCVAETLTENVTDK